MHDNPCYLNNKVALVTGASRGIGAAIALTLARNGAKVIGTATTPIGVDSINQALEQFAGCGILLDVNDPVAVKNSIDYIEKDHGHIAILVNNAGITQDNLLIRMSEDQWDAVIDTNLKSVFRLSKAVIRNMIKQSFGRIINIASIVAITGNAGQVNYASAKAGMIGFTKSLAQEVGSRNITVNAVAPGFIITDMTQKLPQDIQEQYIKHIALQRFGNVDEIANSVLFLASDLASYITSAVLNVNGGQI